MPMDLKSDVEAAYDGGDLDLKINGQFFIYERGTERVISPEKKFGNSQLVRVGTQLLNAVMPQRKDVEPNKVRLLSDLFGTIASTESQASIITRSDEVRRLIAELCPDLSIDSLVQAHAVNHLTARMLAGERIPDYISRSLARDGQNGSGKHDGQLVFNLALALDPKQNVELLKQKLGISF